jgi:hypothetical protein
VSKILRSYHLVFIVLKLYEYLPCVLTIDDIMYNYQIIIHRHYAYCHCGSDQSFISDIPYSALLGSWDSVVGIVIIPQVVYTHYIIL